VGISSRLQLDFFLDFDFGDLDFFFDLDFGVGQELDFFFDFDFDFFFDLDFRVGEIGAAVLSSSSKRASAQVEASVCFCCFIVESSIP